MRADPTSKGSIGRELILDAMRGKLECDHATVRLSGERRKKTVPTSGHNDLRTNGQSILTG
eukprot:5322394-Pyramimonas_sp.AAC.1